MTEQLEGPRAGRVLPLLLVALAAPASVAAQTIAELDVQPRSVRLSVGERKEILASAYDQAGNILSPRFRWVSRDPAIVRVEEDAAVTGVAYLIGTAPGVSAVDVNVGNRQRTVTVEVVGVGPAGGDVQGAGTATVLQVEPAPIELLPAEDVQLRAIFLKDDGTPAAPTAVAWRSFRPDVATVDQNGRAVGIAPGIGLIEATTPTGLQRRVQVQVQTTEWAFLQPVVALSPAQSDTVDLVVPAQGRRRLDPRWITWRTSDPSVASVSARGVVTAIAPGQAEILGSGFGQQSRLPVSVHREVEFLDVVPRMDSLVVPLGGSFQFRATALAADETPVPQAPIVWRVSDSSVVKFDPATQRAAGQKIGTTELAVEAPGDLRKTWTVRVVAAGLVLDPDRLGVGRDERPTLRASFADGRGRPLAPAGDVSWTSSAPDVVRVDARGTLTPVGFGRAAVVAATPWGNRDTATVFVTGEILVASLRDGQPEIYAFERGDPATLNRLTDAPSQEFSPVYSPDGTRIAFVSDRDGNFELYVMDADGANPVRLTTSAATEGNPTWTADGRAIVYQSDLDGSMQLWTVALDGAAPRQLTQGGRANMEPAVSPDGGTIAFTTARDGNYDIYLMNPDGTNQRGVATSPANETVAAWAPAGDLLYLREERSGRNARRTVVRRTPGGEETRVTEPQLMITAFAVSRAGDLLAAVVASPGPRGRTIQRLFLIPLDEGTPVEVPRSGERDQLVTPSFRP